MEKARNSFFIETDKFIPLKFIPYFFLQTSLRYHQIIQNRNQKKKRKLKTHQNVFDLRTEIEQFELVQKKCFSWEIALALSSFLWKLIFKLDAIDFFLRSFQFSDTNLERSLVFISSKFPMTSMIVRAWKKKKTMQCNSFIDCKHTEEERTLRNSIPLF